MPVVIRNMCNIHHLHFRSTRVGTWSYYYIKIVPYSGLILSSIPSVMKVYLVLINVFKLVKSATTYPQLQLCNSYVVEISILKIPPYFRKYFPGYFVLHRFNSYIHCILSVIIRHFYTLHLFDIINYIEMSEKHDFYMRTHLEQNSISKKLNEKLKAWFKRVRDGNLNMDF